jgi:hypothetical protein
MTTWIEKKDKVGLSAIETLSRVLFIRAGAYQFHVLPTFIKRVGF